MNSNLKAYLVKHHGLSANASESQANEQLSRLISAGVLTTERCREIQTASDGRVKEFAQQIVKETVHQLQGGTNPMSTQNSEANPADIFGDGTGIRVKSASEMYRHQKNAAVHPKTGMPVYTESGRQAQLPSELEQAKIGVWLKHLARRGGQNLTMSEHESNLLEDIFQKDSFCGEYQGNWVTALDGLKVKTLLNDSLSGGAELVQTYFDDMLVSYPLLHSEIFPYVTLVPVPRGNSVETGAVGNPTVTWGIEEGTPIGPFDTDGLVTGIDATIHPVTVACLIGRDLLSDSPADIGRQITDNINQRMAAELDRVIVAGNGTSEPQGVLSASGIASVNSSNGTGGPPTYADYLALMFGIGKVYRTPAQRPFYVTTDSTYQRSRNIKVDTATPSTDQRPVLNTVNEVGNYISLGARHAIQQNLTNSQLLFGAFSKYRIFRRSGAETRWESGGKELALTNSMLLTVRARYGGKVVDPNAFCKMIDGQA